MMIIFFRIIDVSQPSLGGEPDHERFETPPLSPLCSIDGATGSGSGAGTSGGSKVKGSYGVKSPGVTMATHWEESVQPPSSGTKHKVPQESRWIYINNIILIFSLNILRIYITSIAVIRLKLMIRNLNLLPFQRVLSLTALYMVVHR